MRLTRDEAFRLKDRFDDWIEQQIGEDVTISHSLDEFSVELLRKKKRVPRGGSVPTAQRQ